MPKEFKYGIVDLDLPVFRAAAAAQKTWYDMYDSDGEFVESYPSAKDYKDAIEELEQFLGVDTAGYRREARVVVGDFENATDALKEILKSYKKLGNYEEEKYFIGGDSADNFRNEVATVKGYKSGRPAEKPVHLKALRAWAMREFNPVVAKGVECDDLVSIELYKDYEKGLSSKDKGNCQCVLVSIDKDSKVTPGWHLNPNKDSEPEWITTADARKWLFTMAIGGDTADAIVGVPGYGYAKAEKALEGCRSEASYWNRTVGVFKEGWTAYCDKPKGKKEGYVMVDENTLSYIDKEGNRVQKPIEDIAEENVHLVYMLRKSTKERWKRP